MLERRHPLRRDVTTGLLLGTAAGALLGLCDGLVITGARGYTSGSSALRGAVYLLLIVAGAGAALGLVQGLVYRAVMSLAERVARREDDAGRVAVWLVGIVLSPLVALVASQVFQGRAAQRIEGRHVYAVAIGAAMLAVIIVGAWLVRTVHGSLTTHEARPRVGLVAAAVLLLLLAGTYAADALVLPRGYPWFHVTLTLVALCVCELMLAAAFLALRRTKARAGELLYPGFAAAVAGLSVLGGVTSYLAVTREPEVRAAIYEHGVIGPKVLSLASRVAPGIAPPRSAATPSAAPATGWAAAGPRLPGRDLVLVSIDALRADHLGAYGYGRPTSPQLDALARRGVVFERAYAQLPHTSFSIATLLTGKYVHALVELGLDARQETLADVLRRYRYKTAAFYPPSVFFIDGARFEPYARSHFVFEYAKFEFLGAEARTDQVIRFLETERPQRALIWVHYFDTHEPYTPRAGPRFGTTAVDRYDAEIAEVDAAVGRLFRYLDEKRPGAVVAVVADHGEEFGEHGGRYHGTTLYDEQLRVPFLLRAPGVRPRRVAPPVELVDVPVTLLSLVDVPPSARMRGTDLTPLLGDPPADPALAPPAFAELGAQKMVVHGGWKLIVDFARGYELLFDLGADPAEKRNLSGAAPDRAARLRGELERWLGSHRRMEQLTAGAPSDGAIARARLGDAGAAAGLGALLEAPSTPLEARREAARLLCTLPPEPKSAPGVAAARAAADPGVSGWALLAAARLGDDDALERLPERVRGDEELRVRWALALAARKARAGAPVLGACAAGQVAPCTRLTELRREAVESLGALGDRGQLPALVKATEDVLLRPHAVRALGALGDRRAVPLVRRLLRSDPYVHVRMAAASALVRLAGPAARASLARAARDTEPEVAEAARAALRELERAG